MKELLDWKSISFADPYFFLLFLLIPLGIWWQWRTRNRQRPSFRMSTIRGLDNLPPSWRIRLLPLLAVCRWLALSLLILAMARPQNTQVMESIDSEGIDIVLSIDVSGSMLAEDLKPNRIEAAKKVAQDFVRHRPTDRIGLVIFAGESFTQCPITIDHQVVLDQIEQIRSGLLVDGTAIGMGLATGVDRLRYAQGKSRILILLTDGVNNTGLIDPMTALEIAKTYGVRVYTIGVGSLGRALYPVQTDFGMQKQMHEVKIDEELLKRIASETGGQYYRATTNKGLDRIYQEIDQLEKTKAEVSIHRSYKDLYFPLVAMAIGLLSLEWMLRFSLFRSLT